MKLVYRTLDVFRRGFNKLLIEPGMKKGFSSCGEMVKIGAGCELKPLNNIAVGNHTEIGPRALFWTTRAKMHIGDNVIFGPGVTIITGDHPTNVVGRSINSIKESEKPLDCDQDVVIDNDVWIGCNSTILKGVHIHEGAVVAAGSVVTRSIPSYEIWGGVPAKKIKDRFTPGQFNQHIKLCRVK